jgi:hypothetical protein
MVLGVASGILCCGQTGWCVSAALSEAQRSAVQVAAAVT